MRDWRPPAVTTEFFDLVCPHPTIVHVGDTKSALAEATASTIFNAFVAKLDAIEDNCIELQEDSGQVIDFWIFGFGLGFCGCLSAALILTISHAVSVF